MILYSLCLPDLFHKALKILSIIEPHIFFLDYGTMFWHHSFMKRRRRATLKAIFSRPTSGGIRWSDILALFLELGAEVTEREGSRVGVRLFGERRVFHRPHPSPDTDKGCIESIRKWLEQNGVNP